MPKIETKVEGKKPEAAAPPSAPVLEGTVYPPGSAIPKGARMYRRIDEIQMVKMSEPFVVVDGLGRKQQGRPGDFLAVTREGLTIINATEHEKYYTLV